MPAMTSILLRKDSDNTDAVFFPVRDVPFPHWRTNVSGMTEAGQSRIESQFEKQKNGKTRVNVKIIKPIMAVIPAGTVNAAGVQAGPTVVDEESVSVTFFLSPSGTDATRAELTRMLAHLMSGGGSTTGQVAPVTGSADTYKVASSAYVVPYAIINLLFPGA